MVRSPAAAQFREDRATDALGLNQELLETRRLGEEDFWFFLTTIIRPNATWKMGLHDKIAEFSAQDPDGTWEELILAPRGTYKTTIVTTARTLWRHARDPDNTRHLLHGSVEPQAFKRLGFIREHAETNDPMRALWPDVFWQNPRQAPKWSESALTFRRNVPHVDASIEAAGIQTSITGNHPTDIVFDDAEDEYTTDSPLALQKLKERWKKIRGLKTSRTRETVTGTIWDEDGLHAMLLLAQENRRVYLKSITYGEEPNKRSIWPEEYPMKRLRQLEVDLGPRLYSAFYENNIKGAKGDAFEIEDLQYYGPGTRFPILPVAPMRVGITVDPAWKLGRRNDYSAYLILGVTSTLEMYVIDAFEGRVLPDDLVRRAFDAMEACEGAGYPVDYAGIEAEGMQVMLKYEWDKELARRGKGYKTDVVKHNNVSKTRRILVTTSWTRGKRLWVKKSQSALINEMRTFNTKNRNNKDNLLDCLAMHAEVGIVAAEEWQTPVNPESFGGIMATMREERESEDGAREPLGAGWEQPGEVASHLLGLGDAE